MRLEEASQRGTNEQRTGPNPRSSADEIRVLSGAPTDEELAAIVGVLLARGVAAPAPGAPAPVSRWSHSARPGLRWPDGRLSRPGPGAWRASLRSR